MLREKKHSVGITFSIKYLLMFAALNPKCSISIVEYLLTTGCIKTSAASSASITSRGCSSNMAQTDLNWFKEMEQPNVSKLSDKL